MNRQQIKSAYTLLSALCLLLGIGCMKDKGDYNRSPVNRIQIESIDSSYSVNIGERISIKPVLTFTKDQKEDTSNYTYQWGADHKVGYTFVGKVLLSTQKDLNIVLNEKMLDSIGGFGEYFMFYRATDKRTGIYTDRYFTLKVSTSCYEGWLMLCDTEDGNSRLDMVSHAGRKDTLYTDILKKMNSAYVANGKPGFITTGVSLIYGYDVIKPTNGSVAIFIATGNKGTALGLDTMEYNSTYDLKNVMTVAEPMADWSNSRFYTSYNSGMLYNNKNLYYMSIFSIDGPVNQQDDGGIFFNASPWVAFNKRDIQGRNQIVYDAGNGIFLRYPGYGTTCLSLPKGDLFDFNTGMDLLYMTYVPFNSGEVFAVLKDRNSNKKYLARFTMDGQQHYYAEITGDNIGDATQFAVSPDLGYLFYGAGGKVYEYDPSQKSSILMHDYGARSISVIKFQPFAVTSPLASNSIYYSELARKLVVCTYTKGAPLNSGAMDIYTVPDINRPIVLYQSFSGMGKVVSLAYRER